MELYAFGKSLNRANRKLTNATIDQPIRQYEKKVKDPNYDMEFLKYKYTQAAMKSPAIMDIMTSGILKPKDEIQATGTLASKDAVYGRGWAAKVTPPVEDKPGAVIINGQRYDDNEFLRMVKKALLYPNQPNNQLAKAVANRTSMGVQFLKLLSENHNKLFNEILKLGLPNQDIEGDIVIVDRIGNIQSKLDAQMKNINSVEGVINAVANGNAILYDSILRKMEQITGKQASQLTVSDAKKTIGQATRSIGHSTRLMDLFIPPANDSN